ncbi:uncharacterized protein JN550_013640 [Neoarthrinium moseri]|uniref:uncharacterized protein n=1 Tax=Neoarthrinium moseri TaxID=1658444 RepID=UPI001FDD5513|nr:uncharacterized protein JN550_013640 [Neoarthrinium moseri]KAI1856866.1 hypothetical protein JN550_013640 [Neoarthrinium moseri]
MGCGLHQCNVPAGGCAQQAQVLGPAAADSLLGEARMKPPGASTGTVTGPERVLSKVARQSLARSQGWCIGCFSKAGLCRSRGDAALQDTVWQIPGPASRTWCANSRPALPQLLTGRPQHWTSTAPALVSHLPMQFINPSKRELSRPAVLSHPTAIATLLISQPPALPSPAPANGQSAKVSGRTSVYVRRQATTDEPACPAPLSDPQITRLFSFLPKSRPPRSAEGSPSQLPALAHHQEPRHSLLAEDPGFSEQQSTYAQYPQYAQQSYPTQQSQYVDAFPPMASARRSAGGSGGSLARSSADIFKKKWPRAFFLLATLQAILCIAFEAYTFARFNGSLKDTSQSPYNTDTDVQAQLKTIPTFLALFIFGFLYELVLVWDALRVKNTIQVIGLCIANLALMVYTSIQVDQIQDAIDILKTKNAVEELGVWMDVKGLLIAIPCIIGVCTVGFGLLAWKLYQEFAWDILKHIGADYRMKKRFLHYQIYIALLKFDFFFFIGFTIQFLVVVGGNVSDTEFRLTSAAVPITIAILLAAAWFTRKEWKWGTIFIMLLYLGGLAYFIFKLSRIYDAKKGILYAPVKKSMTAFAVITIILIVMTIINAMVCILNFGHGLKQHLQTRPREMDKDQASYSMNDVKQPQMPSRMTID